MIEPEGPGRLPDGTHDDDFQKKAAKAAAENGGALALGLGGTGKSKFIELVTKELEDNYGYKDENGKSKVILCGFTHVAATNLGSDGVTVLRSMHRDAKRKNSAFIFDEASMISQSLWNVISRLPFTGNIIIIVGDFAGQVGPIGEDAEVNAKFPNTSFVLDLVNNLVVHFKKFRRGTDEEHFNCVKSISPDKEGMTLDKARVMARKRYPCTDRQLHV